MSPAPQGGNGQHAMPNTPPSPPAPESPNPEAPPPRVRIIRWQGVIPLVLVVGIVVVVWRLLLPGIIARIASEAGTKALGTQVDVTGVEVGLSDARLTIGRVQIADPFDTTRNLLDAGPMTLDLALVPLLEQKAVVESLVVAESRWRTVRDVPARSVQGASFARSVMAEVRRFTKQVSVPPLKLLPLDTVKSLVLDPSQLKSVKAAKAVLATADSLEAALTAEVQALKVQETIDAGTALVTRLQKESPRSLGINGTRQAISDVRALTQRVEATKRGVEGVITKARAGADTLKASVRRVDLARKADYAFARSLLTLPSFEGPDFSNALFGEVSIARFEQALYYAQLAEQWIPPGLKPREDAGPERLRMSGTTVHFPKEKTYPKAHIKRALVRFAMADGAGRPTRYRLAVRDATTEPALVGAPLVASVVREAAGSGVSTLSLDAVIDHRGATSRDSVAIRAGGVALPGLTLPGLPMRLEPGTGSSALHVARRGTALSARWNLDAPKVTWAVDSAALASRNALERVAVDVLRGVPRLTLEALLSGTMADPSMRVSTNLDDAIAGRMRQMLGEQVAKAEARARAEVDRQVAKAEAEARARVDKVIADANRRLEEARQKLDAEKAALDARIKAMSGGVLGLPR